MAVRFIDSPYNGLCDLEQSVVAILDKKYKKFFNYIILLLSLSVCSYIICSNLKIQTNPLLTDETIVWCFRNIFIFLFEI